MSLYQRVIVAVDGSPAAHAGLRAAISLAQEQQARLKIVAVADEASGSFGGAELGWIEKEGLNARLKGDAERLLNEAAALAAAVGLAPENELVEAPDGQIARHITEAAAAWQADLIVVGTHGRHGLMRWLTGSTTEALLRELRLPLLVVPCAQTKATGA